MTEHNEPNAAGGLARLFVPMYLEVNPGDGLSEARALAKHVGQRVALLERLHADGWEVNLDEFDDGIADFSGRRKFDSVNAAITSGLEAGAHGRMLEWAGELDYYCVSQDHLERIGPQLA
jgi:hypothetical protein